MIEEARERSCKMAADMKTCRDCGAEFKRSAADATVRCRACRASKRASTRSTTADWEAAAAWYVEAGKARAAGRAAAIGSAEYEAAVARFRYCTDRVDEARAKGVRI